MSSRILTRVMKIGLVPANDVTGVLLVGGGVHCGYWFVLVVITF